MKNKLLKMLENGQLSEVLDILLEGGYNTPTVSICILTLEQNNEHTSAERAEKRRASVEHTTRSIIERYFDHNLN